MNPTQSGFRVGIIIWVCLLSLSAQVLVLAETNEGTRTVVTSLTPASDKTLNMTAQEFAAWVKSEASSLRRVKYKPVTEVQPRLVELRNALTHRLQAQKWTMDDSVMEVVRAWEGYESPRPDDPGQRDAEGHLFPQSQHLLADLLPLVADRHDLQAKLHSEKAYFYETDGDHKNAIEEYQLENQLLTNLQVEMDRRRIGSLVQMANHYLALEEKPKAESFFRLARSYQWYFVKDAEAQEALRQLYIQATLGLITVLHGNLKGLESVTVIPATKAEITPILDKAIQEAALTNLPVNDNHKPGQKATP